MKIIGVFVVLFFAMIEDVQSRKIRNVWVLCIAILNWSEAWVADGLDKMLLYPARVFLWILPFLVLWKIKAIGAGDAKLMAVLAAGTEGVYQEIFWISFLGCAGVLALWKMIRAGGKGSIPLAIPMWFGYVTILIRRGGLC